jgi:hypothetical protein
MELLAGQTGSASASADHAVGQAGCHNLAAPRANLLIFVVFR